MIRTLCSLVSLMVLFNPTVSLPASSHASLRSIEIANYHSRQLNNTSVTSNTDPPIKNEATNQITITQPNITVDYPVVTKYEPQYAQEKTEPDSLSIEDLKSKCKHLQKLLNLNRTEEHQNRPSNHQYPEMHARPIYLNPRPTTKPLHSSTTRPNGFYVTAQYPGSNDRRPSVTVQTTPTPIKYIRLEPVILQKTILSDGRMVYYWHKSLPTAVEYPANYTPPAHIIDYPMYQDTDPPQNVYGYAPANSYAGSQSVYSSYYYPAQYQNANAASSGYVEATTTEATTTTTEASYSYGLSNFLPFYGYASEDTTSTTTSESTSSVTPSTPLTETNSQALLYAQQLRFVIPVPYEDTQRQQYGFDQYAYYPKQLQPDTVNVRVPYSPTFHMIRAVAVPKVEGGPFKIAEGVE